MSTLALKMNPMVKSTTPCSAESMNSLMLGVWSRDLLSTNHSSPDVAGDVVFALVPDLQPAHVHHVRGLRPRVVQHPVRVYLRENIFMLLCNIFSARCYIHQHAGHVGEEGRGAEVRGGGQLGAQDLVWIFVHSVTADCVNTTNSM